MLKGINKYGSLADVEHGEKAVSKVNGCDFLGYIVRPTHLLARRRAITNFTEKLDQYESVISRPWYRGTLYEASPEELAKLEAIVASYEGQFRHAATFRLLNNIRKKYPFLRIYFKSDRKNQKALSTLNSERLR